MDSKRTLGDAKVGSLVEYNTPQKQKRRGKVVMKFATHVVLNCGGRYGTPAVVDEKNFSRIVRI